MKQNFFKIIVGPISAYRLIFRHFFITVLQSVILAATIYTISKLIYIFFGPHYEVPITNEEWLWSLTSITALTLAATEILLWIFRSYQLLKKLLTLDQSK